MQPPADGREPATAPWVDAYPAGVPATYGYPSVPAGRLLDDAAQDFPDVVAIEYRRYRLTYRKLADHVDRLATALTALGVQAGDRVAVVLPNCPQVVIALFAVWRIGAAATLLTPETSHARLPGSGVRGVIAFDRWYPIAVAPLRPALAPGTKVVVTRRGDYLPFPRNVASAVWATLRRRPRIPETEDVLSFADLVRRNLPAPRVPTDPAELDALSTPQAITQHRLVVNSFQLRLWLPDVVAGDERVLLAVPLSSPYGLGWMVTAVLSAATMVLVDDSRAAVRQRRAYRSRPTLLPIEVGVADDLLRSSWRRGNLRSVRIAMSRDHLAPTVRADLEDLTDKGRVRRAWGLRGVITHAEPVYGRAEPGSVGLPLPDTDVAVAAADGTRMPPGRRGRLWLRGPQLCGDQWVDAATDATLDGHGYLTLGAD